MKNNAFKINKEGHLEIKRAGKFKLQSCPRKPELHFCGDWCPLFHEPILYDFHKIDMIEINLCHGTIMVETEKFSDERIQY